MLGLLVDCKVKTQPNHTGGSQLRRKDIGMGLQAQGTAARF
jgi:hypothetical protein